MSKTYTEFKIRTNPFLPEIVSGVLWELNISGITEEDNLLKIFTDGDSVSTEVIENLLGKLVEEKLLTDFSVDEQRLENKNWNEEWEKNLSVIKVSEQIVIKPTFKNYTPEKNEIVLVIDPKMSFGTGEHQTTRMMIQLIEKYIVPGGKILDIGSGTAILSIVALKLGAEKAIAIDNDELCFINGNENCRLNRVENKIDIRTGEIKDINDKDYDLIFANIQKNIIIEIADQIKYRLKKNGLVFLSGLLDGDEKEIVEQYSKIGFRLIDKLRLGEWVACAFSN
jgi:ribosomal protein L11 methyltransferase